jgi:prepilin-type N-terminal cleavage/methylation domain-containing protein
MVRSQPHSDIPRKGFTLVELLVVLLMIGIVASIAIRSVGDTMQRDRVVKLSAILSTDLEQAFATAGRLRQPVRILIDSSKRTFSIANRADTTLKYRTRQFVTGDLAIGFISASRNTLDIMPSGLATDTLKLRIGIYSKNGTTYRKTLRMTRGGLVRVQ